ncbi:hypothetical protein BGZ98_002479 [Dissophora globulifera]|nr:hypothetical protein BGZ98_002479 [Dissophora globulifera]
MPAISLYFVRHGQRIDQVDSSWADTSPCPQDPPLTAQGKMQARQTGWMIRDFAHESSSSSASDSSCAFLSNETTVDPQQQQENGKWTVQRITPPDSPDHQSHQQATMQDNTANNNSNGDATASGLPVASEAARRSSTTGASKRKHHFAIVTSPFLRCSQTAIEIAIGMRMSGTNMTIGSVATTTTDNNCALTMNNAGAGAIEKDRDLVTISVESALAGKSLLIQWLSLEYVSEPVPDSIIVQRMQDFAMSRRDHEQYYGIDWKYQAKERQLPSWPETHEDMQARLERALQHIIESYTGPAAKDKDRDLSIVFVTHASPVNETYKRSQAKAADGF